jgi:hypothetical protein
MQTQNLANGGVFLLSKREGNVMVDHAIEAVSKAVFTVLDGDAALTGKIAGVYRHVPQGIPLPYVVIGQGRSEDFSGIGYRAFRVRLTLLAYSEANGSQELLNIFNALEEALEATALIATGWDVLSQRYLGLDQTQTRRQVFEGEGVVEVVVREV